MKFGLRGTPPRNGQAKSQWTWRILINMELSQARTRAVLEYALQLPALGPTKNWTIKQTTANGLSSSRIILGPDGKEDAELSRRVEFRVRTNVKEQIVRVIEAVQ